MHIRNQGSIITITNIDVNANIIWLHGDITLGGSIIAPALNTGGILNMAGTAHNDVHAFIYGNCHEQ